MRILPVFALLAFAACGSGNGSGNGPDGGSTGQCNDIANQVCQKAAACSAGGDAGTVFVISADDAGVHAYDFTINSESGCQVLVGAGCNGSHSAAFTANCGSAVSSGLQCGPSVDDHGNGLVLPASCWQSL
jgi:hypothetical protein